MGSFLGWEQVSSNFCCCAREFLFWPELSMKRTSVVVAINLFLLAQAMHHLHYCWASRFGMGDTFVCVTVVQWDSDHWDSMWNRTESQVWRCVMCSASTGVQYMYRWEAGWLQVGEALLQLDWGLLVIQVFQLSYLYLYEPHLTWIWAPSACRGKAGEPLGLTYLPDPRCPAWWGGLKLSEVRWISSLGRNTWNERSLPNHPPISKKFFFCTVEWLSCPHSLIASVRCFTHSSTASCLTWLKKGHEESPIIQLLVQVGHLDLQKMQIKNSPQQKAG